MFTFCEHLVFWCTILVVSCVTIMDLAEWLIVKYHKTRKAVVAARN